MPSLNSRNAYCLGDIVQYVCEFAVPDMLASNRYPTWQLFADLEVGFPGTMLPVNIKVILVEMKDVDTEVVGNRMAFLWWPSQTGMGGGDEDTLRRERPGWYSRAIEFVDDAKRVLWVGAVVPMIEAIIEELYQCEVVSEIDQKQSTLLAGEVTYARYHVAAVDGPVCACVIWQEGQGASTVLMNLPAYGYSVNWNSQRTFGDWDLNSGIVVQRVSQTESAENPSGGSGEIDLTGVTSKLSQIKDAIDDISLNASFDNGRAGVTLRGTSGGD